MGKVIPFPVRPKAQAVPMKKCTRCLERYRTLDDRCDTPVSYYDRCGGLLIEVPE